MQNDTRLDYVWVGILSMLLMVIFLGDVRTLHIPDEGRYAGVAVEMLRSGDFLMTRLNGMQYLYKPPLMYWMDIVALQAFDSVEFATRFTRVLVSWATILMTLWFARRFFDRTTALLSVAFLSTSFMWYIGGRSVNMDLPVAGFVVMGMYLYFIAFYEQNRTHQTWYAYGMYVCLAAAVMTKAFMGILLPGLVFFIHILCTNGWRQLLNMRLITGGILFLGLTLPWHLWIHNANPEWFDFYVIREHVARFFTDIHNRVEPWWYFIAMLAIGLVPYGTYVVQPLLRFKIAWQEHKNADGLRLYLLIWIWAIFLFFSASSSKLPLYVLPIVPPICILSAQFMSEVINGKHYKCASISAFIYMIFVCLVGAYVMYLAYDPTQINEKDVIGVRKVIPNISTLVYMFGFGFILHGFIHFVLLRKQRFMMAIIISVIVYIPSIILINPVVGAVNLKSTKDVITFLKPIHNGEEIILSRFIQDVPTYLDGHVSVVNYSGESLPFLYFEDMSDTHYDTAEFQRRWMGTQKKYMIVHKYRDMYLLKGMPYTIQYESDLYYLITNK